MDRLRRALAAGQWVLTSEVGPPKGTDVAGVVATYSSGPTLTSAQA